jgi:drug/metabolite transporter (DMT)-like permease
MKIEAASPIKPRVQRDDETWWAWGYTITGVLCFSLGFPMTKLALAAFEPITVMLARGIGAGVLAIVIVWVTRMDAAPGPVRPSLYSAGAGIVLLFPFLSSISLTILPVTHTAVVAAVLPLLTALFGVVRGRERAGALFWVSGLASAALVWLFCARGAPLRGAQGADALLLLACIACAFGYAEGGVLARTHGGWRVICWILVAFFPICAGLGLLAGACGVRFTHTTPGIPAWSGLFYVTCSNQFLGFYFFYRGLALGGVARMSQLQFFQPLFSVVAAAILVGEKLGFEVWLMLAALSACVAFGRRQVR